MRSVRVWFSKYGRAKYISHLDLMRFMTRAIRRSGIPIWYTEGFSPHAYMTFPLPLSLGQESRCECMDIRAEGDITNDEILAKLSAVMPEGIEITAVCEPQMQPKAIAWGEYLIEFETENPEALCKRIKALLASDSLTAKKIGKKNGRKVEKEINLLPSVHSYSLTASANKAELTVILQAGLTVNINPALLAESLLREAGAEKTPTNILRMRLLTEKTENFA